MLDDSSNLQLVQPVGYLGTGKGTIEVVLGHSPSYYQLHADREDFDEQLAILVSAWKSQSSVRATIQGTKIVSVEPA
ncbi:MAG: hypothetical protein ACR2ML_01485 [Solirubrobacteraceae bacterium]